MALSRHVARSSWIDGTGARRMHRLYYRTRGGRYTVTHEPMLVAGMGLTLEGIRRCAAAAGDADLARFVAECHATYARYQHPAGFFLSATGWKSEADVAPSTAWHSHDAWHLLWAHGERALAPIKSVGDPIPGVSLLVGETCFYAEMGYCPPSPLRC